MLRKNGGSVIMKKKTGENHRNESEESVCSPEKKEKKQFYLKWPWNLVVYILLVVLFRVFSIPLILLLMWWNKKQQLGGPAEGYCMQRARGQLIQLVWAAVALLMAAAGRPI